MSADLQTVARFSDPMEAQLACNRLRDEGLNAVVVGDLTGGMVGLGYSMGTIDVLVPAAEYEGAMKVLRDYSQEIHAAKNRPANAIMAELPPVEMQADPDEEQPTVEPIHLEYLTDRAYRASIFGYVLGTPLFPVLHFYAAWILLYVTFSKEEIRESHTNRYYVAFALCAISVAVGCAVMLNLGDLEPFFAWLSINIVAAALLAYFTKWKKNEIQ